MDIASKNMDIASIIFFCFNYYIFAYVSKIIANFNKNRFVYICISLLNTYFMVYAYNLKSPYYVSYFVVLFTLVLEFKLFSKATITQLFLCSGLIVINICLSQSILAPVYSFIIGMTPYELFNSPNDFYNCVSILFIILFIIFSISLKFISKDDIIRISTSPMYALMTLGIIIFILLYTIVDITVFQDPNYIIEYLPINIATQVLSIILFYILFFFTIRSSKIVLYKRKSDELTSIKLKTSISKKNIEDKIMRDDLTKCYNRRYAMLDLDQKYKDNIYNFCILFIDIDGLKNVNDTLGHDIGDEYIINVSNALKESVRENDPISRIGGDEFLIIINDIDENSIKPILKRITKNIDILDSSTKNYKVSASIGCLYVTEDILKSGVDNILKISDKKMRLQKHSSKGE